jgi:hypothetical protein
MIDCRGITHYKVGDALGDIAWQIHRQMLLTITQQHYIIPQEIISANHSKTLYDLGNWLNRIAEYFQVAIFLDEFSVFTDWCKEGRLTFEQLKHLRYFFKRGGDVKRQNIKYILIFQLASQMNLTRADSALLDQHVYDHAHEKVIIRPFEREQIMALLHHDKQKYKFSDEAADYIFDLSGGVAYTATVLAREIWFNTAHLSSGDVITLDILHEIINDIFRDRELKEFTGQSMKQFKPEVIRLLKIIAEFEQQHHNTMWKPTDIVNSMSGVVLTEEIDNLLKRLKETGIVDQLPDGAHWHIRGRLLSMYLARTPFDELEIKASLI